MSNDQTKPASGEVVNLHGGSVVLNERCVNEGAIWLADWLMCAAQSGEIVGIAVAYVYADGGTGRAMNGSCDANGTIGQLMKLVGKLTQE